MIFGTDSEQYNTVIASLMSLTSIIMGESEYKNLSVANPQLAPLFFFTFQLLVAYVLLNMLLAIIVDTYSDIKCDQGIHDGIGGIFGESAQMSYWTIIGSKLREKWLRVRSFCFSCSNTINSNVADRHKAVKNDLQNITILDFYAQMKAMDYTLIDVVTDANKFNEVFDRLNERNESNVKSDSDSTLRGVGKRSSKHLNNKDDVAVNQQGAHQNEVADKNDGEQAETRLQRVIEVIWSKEQIKLQKGNDKADTVCSIDSIKMVEQKIKYTEDFLMLLEAKLNTLDILLSSGDHIG
ncbi:hypothetical protein GJ496_003483 [Pomphorhynchus laevis]|nr:hypothetical protein GJ496_003483 [Pomphorhynchus laevis]